MKRLLTMAALIAGLVAATPATAWADVTAFWGLTPKPAARAARGFSFGVGLILVGFEFEYSNTAEDELDAAPGLRTGMVNGLVQTPTRMQLYLTAGGGFYREVFRDVSETSFGTNIGGGVKIPLAGPFRIRVDYRLFNLRGDALYKNPQRIYAGLNVAF